MSIRSRALRVINSVLRTSLVLDDQVSREAILRWDSLKHLEICFALEEEFSIELAEYDIEHMKSLDDIARTVSDKGAP